MSILSIHNFSYQHKNGEPLFENINLQINEKQKVALVGRNGIGKTTLLQSVLRFEAYSAIKIQHLPYYIPQYLEAYNHQTIATILKVEDKLTALHAIVAGSTSQQDYDMLEDDWNIENNIKQVLEQWNLKGIEITTPFDSLSGGEKLKVFFAGISLHNPSFVILDEPTNHLDFETRETLYRWIEETSSTLLIVSHDRYLLNLLTDIYELTADGVNVYTGNYNFYLEQKRVEQDALQRQLDSQKQELKQAKKQGQEIAERRQRLESRGAAQTAKKALPRIVANARRAKADRTTAGIKGKQEERINKIHSSIKKLEEDVDKTKGLKINIESSTLHQGKILVEALDLNFKYGSQELWNPPLNFFIQSGDRVLIKGNNGSGKTTLIKLITSISKPSSGSIKVSDFNYLYLDQDYSLIDNTKTVYEQAQSYNIDMPEYEVKTNLARSQFAPDSWNTLCLDLSGGEKMKLSLCSLIISKITPDVLLLDEPTNNLDIDSMEILNSSISQYSGTLIMVSHDRYFTDHLAINKVINL